MNEPGTSDIGKDLRRLGDSPLFRLSLASNELFHSNFIHWLLQHPNDPVSDRARALFCELIGFPERRIVDPQREKDHNDLVMTLEACAGEKPRKVIVENKIKSWRDRWQLEAYAERERKKGDGQPVFILLSMTTPPEAEASGWTFLSYDRLNESFIKPLKDFADAMDEAYLSALLDDYSSMIAKMTQILEGKLFPDWKDRETLGNITPARIEELSDMLRKPYKLNAIFEKGLFERFEAMAADILGQKIAAKDIYRERDDKKVPEGCFKISSDYSSMGQKGCLTLAHRCKGGLVIGVQIEGFQYRHFVSHVDKGISVEQFFHSYFDPQGVDARSLPGTTGASAGMKFRAPSGNSTYKECCSFEDKHFLYLHASIKDKPMSGILELAVEDILRQAQRAIYLVPRATTLTERP
jgi:hypothetical protein